MKELTDSAGSLTAVCWGWTDLACYCSPCCTHHRPRSHLYLLNSAVSQTGLSICCSLVLAEMLFWKESILWCKRGLYLWFNHSSIINFTATLLTFQKPCFFVPLYFMTCFIKVHWSEAGVRKNIFIALHLWLSFGVKLILRVN